MIKTLMLSSLACASGLVGLDVLPSPFGASTDPEAAPTGLYLEARDATVWGGACHISSEAESGGRRALLGVAFQGGSYGGVDLGGVEIVAAIEGTFNLQAAEVFGTEERPTLASEIWVDAPSEEALVAAVDYLRQSADLGVTRGVHDAKVSVSRTGDAFELAVEGVLQVEGLALADRSCCTMPESRWYSPLLEGANSIVGNPEFCRFEGRTSALESWSFQGENSVFVGMLPASATAPGVSPASID